MSRRALDTAPADEARWLYLSNASAMYSTAYLFVYFYSSLWCASIPQKLLSSSCHWKNLAPSSSSPEYVKTPTQQKIWYSLVHGRYASESVLPGAVPLALARTPAAGRRFSAAPSPEIAIFRAPKTSEKSCCCEISRRIESSWFELRRWQICRYQLTELEQWGGFSAFRVDTI